MKKNFSQIASLALFAILMSSGCRTVTDVKPVTIVPAGPPTSLPSAGIIGIHPITTSANTGDFEIDLFVTDTSGNVLTNLAASAISILSAINLDTVFSQLNVNSLVTPACGAYSAELLLDQTGSIRQTDPLNLRLIAGKIFLEATGLLAPADEVQLSTFQDSLHNGTYMHTYGSFTHNTGAFVDTVEGLASKVGGGTPLYDAMYNEIDAISQQAHNPNKVLIVFTDGEDNESGDYYPGAGLWDVIHHAISEHVIVFAVALQVGLDTALISAALNTGGGIMQTNDAKQMVSYFGAMSHLLQGQTPYYSTKWHVSLPKGTNLSGQSVSGNISIKLP